MHAILSTAQQLTGEFDLEQLLQRSIDHLLRLSDQDRGFIMIENGGNLEIIVQRNLASGSEGEPYLSMSTIKRVFETGEPIWLTDVSSNEAIRSQQSVVDLKLKTILCLPLPVKGINIGVVYLDSHQIKQDPLDRNAFEAIVGLCAVAIERARLSEEGHRNRVLASLGSAASTIAHDFKNALFLIGGHAELLLNLCNDSEVQYHIEQIQSSVDRLAAMSSEILGIARMKDADKAPVNLTQFLKAEIAKWQLQAKKAGIKITGKGPDCLACIDAAKFTSVMDNLITNSIESMTSSDTGGKIQIIWSSTKKGVTIKVCDNGKGIPKKILAKVFNPFFSHGKEKGTGLGMSAVKQIVEMHYGTIDIESQVGQGTTVIISIPHSKGMMPAVQTNNLDEVITLHGEVPSDPGSS
jgi:signal transduction histidine kinase